MPSLCSQGVVIARWRWECGIIGRKLTMGREDHAQIVRSFSINRLLVGYWYVRTFNRNSENHARSELVLSECLEIRFLLRCYEVLDFLVLVLVPTTWCSPSIGYWLLLVYLPL